MMERAGFRSDALRQLWLHAEEKVVKIFGETGDQLKSDLVVALVQSTLVRKILSPITLPLKLFLTYSIVSALHAKS